MLNIVRVVKHIKIEMLRSKNDIKLKKYFFVFYLLTVFILVFLQLLFIIISESSVTVFIIPKMLI